ncbi:MAG: response regulator transcription factor [Gammaproteobacteria bacterium]
MRLLLAEDDTALAQNLKEALNARGYAIDGVDNGLDAEHMGREEEYDLVILDLGLPRKTGLDVLRQWRADGNTVPVLILTARDAWYEKVEGFEAGADDYLAKPFHTEELIARIQALIRRRSGVPGQALNLNGLTLDEERQSVTTPDGETHTLTGTEFRVLRYFMLHPDRIVSKSELTDHVYEYDNDRDSNVIEVYINRLRQKLGKDAIQTRRGQGYVMEKHD